MKFYWSTLSVVAISTVAGRCCPGRAAHLELLQVGGTLPVLVVADAGAAREADGDPVCSVSLGLGELCPRDLPHWGFLHTQGGKHVTPLCALSSQLQVSQPHSLSTPARFHLHRLTFLLTFVIKSYFLTKPEILTNTKCQFLSNSFSFRHAEHTDTFPTTTATFGLQLCFNPFKSDFSYLKFKVSSLLEGI